MNALESIKRVLGEQVVGYRTLIDLLQRERESLLSFDARGVEDLSTEKDTVVLKLRLLEQERQRLMALLSAEAGIPQDASLQKLSEITNDGSFKDLRLQLLSLLQGISELNEFNRILIERSSHMVRSALSCLGSFGMDVGLRNSGAVISREA